MRAHRYLVMEFVPGGEMLEQIVARGRYVERDAAILVRQIVDTVGYLHSQGVVHRDLNPGNILLAGDLQRVEDCRIKVADFGLASFFEHEEQMMYTCCGTPEYVAPEVLQGKGYGYQCDIWSIGIIIYIMLCGYPPFYDESIHGQVRLGRVRGGCRAPRVCWGQSTLHAHL
jgi:calcium/calmodulin-dependent protein kinase I